MLQIPIHSHATHCWSRVSPRRIEEPYEAHDHAVFNWPSTFIARVSLLFRYVPKPGTMPANRTGFHTKPWVGAVFYGSTRAKWIAQASNVNRGDLQLSQGACEHARTQPTHLLAYAAGHEHVAQALIRRKKWQPAPLGGGTNAAARSGRTMNQGAA